MLPSDESEDIITTIKDYYILRVSSGNIRGFERIKNIINMVKQNGYANSCIKICGLSYNEGGVETCSICLDNIVQHQQIPSISCRHKFHDKCLSQWLNFSNDDTCPCCRQNMFDNPKIKIIASRSNTYTDK